MRDTPSSSIKKNSFCIPSLQAYSIPLALCQYSRPCSPQATISGQRVTTTTSCGQILRDPQGEIAYTPAPKKGLLIISSLLTAWRDDQYPSYSPKYFHFEQYWGELDSMGWPFRFMFRLGLCCGRSGLRCSIVVWAGPIYVRVS